LQRATLPQNATLPGGRSLAAVGWHVARTQTEIMVEPQYEASAAHAVARVKRLRLRAAVLFFFGAVAAALLPVTAALALEVGQTGRAMISSAAVGAASWVAFRCARRDRTHARELEQAIEHLLVKPEFSEPHP